MGSWSDTLQNRPRGGGFIQSESNWARSRDRVVIDASVGDLVKACTVLGKLTATGKYKPSPKTGSDGTQTAVAVLFDDTDATLGDVVASVVARDAEVRADSLLYDPSVVTQDDKTAKWAQLNSVEIQVHLSSDVVAD